MGSLNLLNSTNPKVGQTEPSDPASNRKTDVSSTQSTPQTGHAPTWTCRTSLLDPALSWKDFDPNRWKHTPALPSQEFLGPLCHSAPFPGTQQEIWRSNLAYPLWPQALVEEQAAESNLASWTVEPNLGWLKLPNWSGPHIWLQLFVFCAPLRVGFLGDVWFFFWASPGDWGHGVWKWFKSMFGELALSSDQWRKSNINISFLVRISRGHSWPLRPNAQGSKSFSPPPTPQENAPFGADVHVVTIFGADVHDPKGCRKTLYKKSLHWFFGPYQMIVCKGCVVLQEDVFDTMVMLQNNPNLAGVVTAMPAPPNFLEGAYTEILCSLPVLIM